ncbi:cobyrinic acid ac-diamide synthase [Candidatus Vecturithrix granuli]|uniref:Cobyrinic acid ac-diamide synthase n=1 Tax=Vecturithrix granuli TaxID=1499967 RepID=A0A081BWY7_VECG1|nr:cobyrinic acid ac-diamide synthase [Candidatus Vecturithrix granuli]
MIISIASGKGGTGKTTIATNLARSAKRSVMLLDCDVEEPNAHLFMKPTITTTTPVYKPIPQINFEKCTFCAKCAEICEYNALAVIATQVLVFAELCHGCGGCTLLCPEGAISETYQQVGVVERGHSGKVEFVQGILNVSEAMAGPVIRAVKQQINNHPFAILDAPPGTSCPVVLTLQGSDFCILVTEPTPFGLHDLQLAVDVVRQLGIPHGIVLNRADSGDDGVEMYCQQEQIPVLMRLPTDLRIAEAYSRGDMIVDALPQYRQTFQELLKSIAR